MLSIFLGNFFLTLVCMGGVAWYLRRSAYRDDAEFERRWKTELTAMEVSGSARRDFVDERLAVMDRQIGVLEARVTLIDQTQRDIKRHIERSQP